MNANAEPVPERRRAEALRAAAAALDTLGGGTVDDLLRVAEWVLDAHRPQVQRIDDAQLHRELAETDTARELDEQPADRPTGEPAPIGQDLARMVNQYNARTDRRPRA